MITLLKRIFTLAAFIVIHGGGFSQTGNWITLEGKLIDGSDTSAGVSHASIIIYKSHTGTSSSMDGSFKLLQCRVKDEIKISRVGYKSVYFVVNKEYHFVKIKLQTDTFLITAVSNSIVINPQNERFTKAFIEETDSIVKQFVPPVKKAGDPEDETPVFIKVEMLPEFFQGKNYFIEFLTGKLKAEKIKIKKENP